MGSQEDIKERKVKEIWEVSQILLPGMEYTAITGAAKRGERYLEENERLKREVQRIIPKTGHYTYNYLKTLEIVFNMGERQIW